MSSQAVKAQMTENKINSLIVNMGLKVDEAVGQAIAGLLQTRSHVVAGVMENAVAVQELEFSIDQVIMSALEQGELPASDTRRISSLVNISKDMSRLGKLAANLGRKVSEVGKHNDHEDFSSLQPLAIAVSHLCRQTLRSLAKLDLVLARNAAAGGTSVDAYRDYVFQNITSRNSFNSDEQNRHLVFASRCLEQIADHTIHLAENLVTFLESASYVERRQSVAC
jgi:phosphate transport system protein